MLFFKNLFRPFREGDLQIVASSLAFATVLSIVPFLAVALAALQWVDALDFIYPQVEALMLFYFKGPVGSEGLQIIRKAILSFQQGRIGLISSLGLVFTSSLLLNKIEVAIHRIWKVNNRRPLYRRIFFQWLAMIIFPFIVAIFVGLTTTKIIVSILPLAVWHWSFLFVGLFFLYKVVPSTKVGFVSAFVSSLFGTFCLGILFGSFKYLTQTVLTYNKFYGGLAAFPAFLIFVLIFWYIVLFGAALCASLSSRR